jgi:hypothetical protein
MPTPKREYMSPLFDNAIDSLKTGMQFFKDGKQKYALLLVFHSIELLLKEMLSRRDPILIYRNIDKIITDDSLTVGLAEALIRFENLGIPLTDAEKKTVIALQRRRNRIEHHRYDSLWNDKETLGQSLRFIMSFTVTHLQESLNDHIDMELLKEIENIILSYSERIGIAEYDMEQWADKWFKNGFESEEFVGLVDCPVCRQTFLVLNGENIGNYCFFCRKTVDAAECVGCDRIYLPTPGNERQCQECSEA